MSTDQSPSAQRPSRPVIFRNFQSLAAVVGQAYPFGQAAMDKATTNAESSLHASQRARGLDEILVDRHTTLNNGSL